MFEGYLASPYSVLPTDDPAIRHLRFMEAVMAPGWAHKQGIWLYSPIAHTHPIAEHCHLPKSFNYWEAYDEVAIASCRNFYILTLPGWQASSGIQRELESAGKHPDKEIFYMRKLRAGEYIIALTARSKVWEDIRKALCQEPNCLALGNRCPKCKGTRLKREDTWHKLS
jgi:hypothetical protein